MGSKFLVVLLGLMVSVSLFAGFEWGGDCTSGEGRFNQDISLFSRVRVGVIPAGKRGVKINLNSLVDADIQLYDLATGEAIIDWENGVITEAVEVTKEYKGVSYKYSGYNGVDGKLGYEFVEILGDTNRDLVLYAYGYRAGNATVDYSFEAIPTCNEIGDGEFSQYVSRRDTITVGNIPKGKTNVYIELKTRYNRDVDVVLIDKLTGEEVISWPNGLLNGATAEKVNYHGMTVRYSGYNGINNNPGYETIHIDGKVTREFIMKAYGYVAGDAKVKYNWGNGVEQICGTRGADSCETDLFCKEENSEDFATDRGGKCHTDDWCMNNETASQNCGNLPHIMTPGVWGCEEFKCVWRSCPMYQIPQCPNGTHPSTITASNGCTRPVCVADINQNGECSYDSQCENGTICSNFNNNDEVVGTDIVPVAFCEPSWMLNEFNSDDVITIDANSSEESVITVRNLATVGMNAIVSIELDMGSNGASLSDITFEVIPGETGYSTSFRTSIVDPSKISWDGSVLKISELPINSPGDDSPNCDWKLKITNMNVDGKSVRLRDWRLKLSSRMD